MHIVVTYTQEDAHTTGVYFSRALEAIGHQVTHLLPPSIKECKAGYDRDIRWDDFLSSLRQPADAFLYVDPDGILPHGLEEADIPLFCYLIDVHRNLRLRKQIARLFDCVFVAQKDYIHKFGADRHVEWLPLACDPEIHTDQSVERVFDIGFVGRVSDPPHPRGELLKRIRERQYTTNEIRYYEYTEISDIYSRSRIVINYPVNGDLNMRVFEAMSSGALLVTKAIDNGQDDLFENGEHLILFDTIDEAMEQVAYYLSHEEERKKIALAGQRLVRKSHTYVHRLQQTLTVVEGSSTPQGGIRAHRAAMLGDACAIRARIHAAQGSVGGVFAEMRHRRRGGHSIVPLLAPLIEAAARQSKRVWRTTRK